MLLACHLWPQEQYEGSKLAASETLNHADIQIFPGFRGITISRL